MNTRNRIVIILPDHSEVIITYVHNERNGKIRLGIQAPHALPVHRRELWERIKARGLLVQREPHA